MDLFKRVTLLEDVSTSSLRTSSKVVGFIYLICFGFIATLAQVRYITLRLADNFHSRIILYVLKEFGYIWMFKRSLLGFFLVKGVREENVAYIFPTIVEAVIQLSSLLVFFLLASVESAMEPLEVLEITLTVVIDTMALFIVSNYFRRLRKGNLENRLVEETTAVE